MAASSKRTERTDEKLVLQETLQKLFDKDHATSESPRYFTCCLSWLTKYWFNLHKIDMNLTYKELCFLLVKERYTTEELSSFLKKLQENWKNKRRYDAMFYLSTELNKTTLFVSEKERENKLAALIDAICTRNKGSPSYSKYTEFHTSFCRNKPLIGVLHFPLQSITAIPIEEYLEFIYQKRKEFFMKEEMERGGKYELHVFNWLLSSIETEKYSSGSKKQHI